MRVFPALIATISIGAAVVLGAQAARRNVSLIVVGGTVITENETRQILSPGAVAIDGANIVDVGTPAAIAARYTAGQTIEVRDQVVLPGLINTHTHAPMVMYRGLADDLALMDWLQKYIFPAEAKTVSPEFVRIGTRLAALEMIESGTTTYADMYYFEEEIAKATRDAGLRGVLGQTIIQFPVADAKTPAEGLARAEAFIKAFKDDSLIVPAVAPHAMYTNDRATLVACAELARKYGVPVIIHLAETEDEVKTARTDHQMTPAGYLESIGFWGPKTLAAHGVWVTDEDIRILKRRTGGGLAQPREQHEAGQRHRAGCRNIWRPACRSAWARTAPPATTTSTCSKRCARRPFSPSSPAATRPRSPRRWHWTWPPSAGRRRSRWTTAIGSLESGKRADLITVSMSATRQTPMYDAVSHLVYVTRGDDVRTTIVNGKVLMRDRQVRTLNRTEVLAQAKALAQKVKQAVQ